MKKKDFSPALVFLVFLFLDALPVLSQQANELGSPLIHNYSSDEYGAYPQNWVGVQDQRGVVYVGNYIGLVEFDGRNWRLIPVANGSLIRSLAIDRENTIFWGGSADFGYLACDAQGKSMPVSLLDKVEKKDRIFNDVWKIFPTSHGIYFVCNDRIFHYRAGRITMLPVRLARRFGCLADDMIFLYSQDKGLCVLQEDKIQPLPQSAKINFTTFPWLCLAPFSTHRLLLATQKGALFVYDYAPFYDPTLARYDFGRFTSTNPLLSEFPSEVAEYISEKNNILQEAVQIDEKRYAFATAKGGLVIIDRNGRLIRVINKNRGLQDNFVRNLFVDQQKDLWLELNDGIAQVEINSPFSQFNDLNRLGNYVFSAIRHQGRIYAATFGGIFRLADYRLRNQDDNQWFEAVENCGDASASFIEFQNMLLAASIAGVYRIDGISGTRVCEQSGVYCFGYSPRFPDRVFLGLMDGLATLQITGNRGRQSETGFVFTGKLADVPYSVRKIVADEEGNLWLSTDLHGVLYLHFTGSDPSQHQIYRYGKEHGLPHLDWNYVHFLSGRLWLATQAGIYRSLWPAGNRDPAALRFEPERTFGRPFLDPPVAITNFVFDGKQNIWVNSSKGLFFIKKNPDASFSWEQAPFREIPFLDVDVYLEGDGTLWVPTSKALFRYDPQARKDYSLPFQTLIRRVSGRKNTTIFAGTNFTPNSSSWNNLFQTFSPQQPPQLIPVLPFRDNSLAFEYSATFYEHAAATRYCFRLAGFDREWSDWTAESKKEYTNLPEGDYCFQVKAKNIFDRESREASFRFSITPPWSRTWPAYLIYALAASLLMVSILKLYTLRLQREKVRLEKLVAQRTQELKEATLTDPLTGLRNRRYISEILSNDINAFVGFKRYLQEAKNRRNVAGQQKLVFGIFIFDIDHFKKVNDNYSHDAGDRFLRQFAQVLKSLVRSDDVVLRVGGEEFMVVLKNTLPEYLTVFAKKIQEKIRSTDFTVAEGIQLKKTCSIGYTTFPFYEDQPELLNFEHTVMIADLGLLHAKKHGRNQAIFLVPTERIPGNADDIKRMITSLDYALKNNFLNLEKK